MCKIAPRKYVHMLLILSELILIACSITMIVLYKSREWNEIIWMGSKTFTVDELMKINNEESYPILHIYKDGSIENYSENYASLLAHSAHSGEECETNYKKCGILDSLGNIMCIPQNETCPINDIKIGLISNNSLYDSKVYKSTSLLNLQKDYALYFTNTATDKEIISKLSFSNEIPLYVNQHNFIFDEETYISSSSNAGSSSDSYDY